MKRLLDAIKGEAVAEEVMPHFMAAFETLVKTNLSQEVMRSLALFITYAFHTPAVSLPRTPKPMSAISRSSTPIPSRRTPVDMGLPAGTSNGLKYLPKKIIGTKILVMYSAILCEKGSLNNIKKFARTVTNKVSIAQASRVQTTASCADSISGFSIFSLRTTLRS